MKKSAGVTVSGILAILGSVGFLAFGSFAILAGIMLQANPDLIPRQQGIPTATFPIPAVLFMESVVFFGLGIFGITAAIGLLRLRNWARISFAIFGGVLCPLCVLSVLGTLMAMFVLPRIVPPDPNIPPGLLTVLFGFYLIFELLVGALAAWWVVYFTRRKVKEQFMTPAEAGLPRRGPLSITIIAWLLAVSGGLSILYLPFSIPIVLFGIVFHGWMARILLLAFAGGRRPGGHWHVALEASGTFACRGILYLRVDKPAFVFCHPARHRANERRHDGADAAVPNFSTFS